MKQLSIEYLNSGDFIQKLSDVKVWCDSNHFSNKIFQIYSEVLDPEVLRRVCGDIEKVFPDTPYMGCSTSGNIIDCRLAGKITAVCTVFELPSTRARIFSYDLSKESVDNITKAIVEETEKNQWVKAIEMFFTIPEGSTTRFCEGLKNIRTDIQVFGGVACSDDITSDDSCVFSGASEVSDKSIIII